MSLESPAIGGPLVSVIVPMYRVEQYIVACLESIRAQTYSNLQIILVDDGSPDESVRLVESVARVDSRVQIIRQSNAGVSAARNTGLDHAHGDYICFVDGDDTVKPRFVESFVEVATQTGADLVLAWGPYPSPGADADDPASDMKLWKKSHAIAEILYPRIVVGCWNKIYSRELIGRAGLAFETRLRMGEGLSFVLAAAQASDHIAITDAQLYSYNRDHQASATSSLTVSKMLNALEALDGVAGWLDTRDPEIGRAFAFHHWRTVFLAIRVALREHIVRDADVVTDLKKRLRRSGIGTVLRSNVPLVERVVFLFSYVVPVTTARIVNSVRS